MSAGSIVLNQPGVYLVDVDGNAITVTDGLAIGSAEALIIAGKDGSNARFVRVAADGTVRIDPTGTTTQPISAASLPLPAGAATEATLTTRASESTLATRASEASLTAQSLVDNAGFTDGTTRIVPAGFILDETAGTALVENDAGAARIDDKRAQVLVVEDFSVRGRRLQITATNAAKVDGSDVTQPISAVTLPLPTGAATSALQTTGNTSLSNIDTKTPAQGQATMAASSPVVIASDQSAVASKNAAASQVDGHSATIGATADADTALTVIGRLKQIITRLAGGLPASLIGGRLDQNMGSWFGSTVPTVGQKSMAQSIPVCMPTDQTAVLVTFTGTRTGVVGAFITLGGGTAGLLQTLRATSYTEPGAQAQRSFASSSPNDTSAGTGARSVKFVYYDNTGAGPFTETVILSGTTAVATVASDIRFIESIEVVTVGSGGSNVGTITMYVNNSGGGGSIGSIGVGNVVGGAGDNRTLWAHHYVATGVTASLSTLVVGAQSGGSGTSARFFVKAQSVLTANAAEILVGDVLLVQGAFTRLFNFYVKVTGFARLVAYAVPSVNNATLSAAFDYSET